MDHPAEVLTKTDTAHRSDEKYCAQCGERLSYARASVHRPWERPLCADCAFDDVPHTD
jgi:formylmethanofuran dehydrogenase subunit E